MNRSRLASLVGLAALWVPSILWMIPGLRAGDCDRNGRADETELAAGTASDCNGNGLPDLCDLVSGEAQDCNLNGIPDACDIASGLESDFDGDSVPDTCQDCNADGIPDSCGLALGVVADCSGNGIPDPCEPDCNGNDVPDDCDLLFGVSADANGDGVPDECWVGRSDRRFVLGFRGPSRVQGAPGTDVEFTAMHTLTVHVEDPREGRVQGWSTVVGLDRPCHIRSATTDGTVAARDTAFPPGLRRETSFELTEECYGSEDDTVVSAVVLALIEDVALDPQEGAHDILKLAAHGPVPDNGLQSCRFRITNFGCPSGQPIEVLLTVNGESVSPAAAVTYVMLADHNLTPEAATLCGHVPFHRGDANGDGSLDLSDAVFVLRYLFTGARAPGCLEGADAQNDGHLDLTDGMFLLRYLFDFSTPGPPPPPPPGPPGWPCGDDPDPRGSGGDLGCNRYDPCMGL